MKFPASTVDGPLLVKVGSIHEPELKDVTVPNLAEASRICRAMIDEEGLGASEWLGGEVVSEDTGLCVAVISYNGRAWFPSSVRGPEGHALSSELEFDLDV
jgi:hypothetical protein